MTPPPDSDARPIFFIHVPKTGGTTLKNVLSRNYGDEKVLFGPHTSEMVQEVRDLPEEERRKIKLFGGHLPYNFDLGVGPVRYFTMLREPVDRVLSFYYYVLREPDHYLYDFMKMEGHTLREVIEQEKTPMVDNFQVRLLSGVWNVLPYGEVTRVHLDRAKANLETCEVVGLQERFDESLLLMADTFAWSRPYYRSSNVSRGRPQADQLDRETLELVAKANELDIELYEHGRMLFEQRLVAGGPALERRLRRFHRMNSGLGRRARQVEHSVFLLRQAVARRRGRI